MNTVYDDVATDREDQEDQGRSARAELLEHPLVARMQRHHFLLFEALPWIGVAASVPLLVHFGLSTLDLVLFVVMWIPTTIGIEIGYHRYYSHDSFTATPGLETALLVAGALAGEGNVVSWASNHKHHHRYSDAPRDTHSPYYPPRGGRLRGLLHAQVTWKLRTSYVNPALYIPKVLRNPRVVKVSRVYPHIVVAGILFPAAVALFVTRDWRAALTALCFAGLIRMVVVQQSTFLINSVTHTVGTRPFTTKDRSTNNVLLVPLTWGAAWHNNHHAFPMSWTNQHRWWQFDPGTWLLRFLRRLGLVGELHRPTAEALQIKASNREGR